MAMRKVLIIVVVFCLAGILGATQLHHSSVEFDEGSYLTTFMSVNAGFALYKPTSFAQLPGFFILTNPFLLLFGQTLLIARLSIFFWSLIGVCGILWISNILTEDFSFGLLTMAILYTIPLYTKEILTFHIDALPSVFSLLALASILEFSQKKKTIWITFATFFTIIAILTKLDISLLPTIVIVYLSSKRKTNSMLKDSIVSIGTLLITFFLISLPFGLQNVIQAFVFRVLATKKTHMDIALFSHLLVSQSLLMGVFVLGIILSSILLLKKKGNIFLLSFYIWTLTTIFLLFLYHPLELHHFMLLTIPACLLLSYLIVLLKKIFKGNKYVQFYPILLIGFVLLIHIGTSFSFLNSLMNTTQKQAIQIIESHTLPKDFIVSDDELLSPFTNRLTPPGLTDVSFVRIQTGDLSPALFEKNIKTYKPKLVLPITGRLTSISNLKNILLENRYILLNVNFPYPVYIRNY